MYTLPIPGFSIPRTHTSPLPAPRRLALEVGVPASPIRVHRALGDARCVSELHVCYHFTGGPVVPHPFPLCLQCSLTWSPTGGQLALLEVEDPRLVTPCLHTPKVKERERAGPGNLSYS